MDEEILEAPAGGPGTGTEADAAPEQSTEPVPEREDTDALRRELEASRARVEQLERERILLSEGVEEEDLDYYVFRIGKLTSEDQDFAAAAKTFLKQHGARHAALPRSTGASLSGRAARPQSTSDTMNRLLRGNN